MKFSSSRGPASLIGGMSVRPKAGSWTPSLIPGYGGGWSSSHSSIKDLSIGTSITSWNGVGTAPIITQVTPGKRPIRGVIGTGSTPCVVFDGTDDVLDSTTSGTAPLDSTTAWLLIVGQFTALSASAVANTLVSIDSGVGERKGIVAGAQWPSTGKWYCGSGNVANNAATPNASTSDLNPHTWLYIWDIPANGGLKLYLDGINIPLAYATQLGFDPNSSYKSCSLGGYKYSNGLTYYFGAVKIAETHYGWNAIPDSVTRAQIFTWSNPLIL